MFSISCEISDKENYEGTVSQKFPVMESVETGILIMNSMKTDIENINV